MTETTSRRGFLRRVSCWRVPWCFPLLLVVHLSSLLAATTPGSEEYWQMARRQFDFRVSKAPMNASGVTVLIVKS